MIGTALKPWTFVNNTETADGVKVNQNFDVAFQVINELVTALNAASGSKVSLAARLAMSLNDDGTLKASAIPIGTYDARKTRTIDADSELTADDSIILVDTTDGDVTFTLLPAAETTISPTIVNIGLTGHSAIIVPGEAETIMGLAEYQLGVGGESVRLSPDGVDRWWRSG